MDFFYSTEFAIPISQMMMLLFLSTLALLWGRIKLALLINYIFTVYWGYVYQRDFLLGGSRSDMVYIYIYFGFGLFIVFLASVGFMSKQ